MIKWFLFLFPALKEKIRLFLGDFQEASLIVILFTGALKSFDSLPESQALPFLLS